MIIVPNISFLPQRKRRDADATPLAPLALVSATYASDPETRLTLTFNRAIDVSSIDPTAFTLIDASAHKLYQGDTLFGADELTVTINLVMLANIFVPATTMSATDENGIVGADDGQAWAGVEDLTLPFP